MAKTFDEAMAMVGTYLKNNDLSNSDNNDRFFYIILNDLRKEYAPTIKMTNEEYHDLRHYRVHFPLDKFIYDFGELHGTQLSEKDLAQAWIHPETVKVVDE